MVKASEMASRPNGPTVSRSITLTLDDIVSALTTQQNISILGVYGSTSANNNTVVEKITRRVKRGNLIDVVARANVMENPNGKDIQRDLGNMLGLRFREKSVEARARVLCAMIKTKTNILIILDDVRGQIDLDVIGIPFGNDHLGCKILLISETQRVLSDQTDAQIKFEV